MHRMSLATWCSSVACVASLVTTHSFAHAAPMVRKVLIVGVDGMRPDAMLAANTPTFDTLTANGAVSYVCSAEDITISGPGWSTILTGVHRFKHLVTDNSFATKDYANYPHFFVRLQSLCDANTASIADWAPINTQILAGTGGTNADLILSGLGDDAVADSAVSLVTTGNPDVVFLHLDAVDAAGHGYGFDPSIPQYLTAIEASDARAKRVLDAIHLRPSFPNEDWLVIVVTDHGGTIDRTHGRNIPEHRLTPIIISGYSTAVGTTITPAPTLADVPATVMTFLGLPINPAWGWDGQAVGLNMASSPSVPFTCSPPPPPPVGACCLQTGECLSLTQEDCTNQRGTWAGLGTACADHPCDIPTTLLAQNFDAVPLGPNVDETVAGTNVWSPVPPAGWNIDRSGMPTGGITEWRGWSIADRAWWTNIAGDQGRSGFTKGTGAVAVADPDEWDDKAHAAGTFNSSLATPVISLAGVRPETARLFMDSSWLPEGNQTAAIAASFDGAPAVTVQRWSSQPGPDFKSDAPNETVSIDLHAPATASTAQLFFRLTDAGNNWWWALDNLQVTAIPTHPRRELLRETFEEVPLGPNVDETVAGDRVWSGSPPAGWLFDDAGVPGLNDPAKGITEWKGWAITNRPWWVNIAADQGRSGFTKGIGAIAVADPDEWDDKGTPNLLGPYAAKMVSPAVALDAIEPNSLILSLDSSWRPEDLQQALLTARFDTGTTLTLLRYDSAVGPFFKPDATNEHLDLPIANPAGAQSVTFTFTLQNARNNWWWAVDNIVLTGIDAGCPCPADFDNSGGTPDASDIDAFFIAWLAGDASADADCSGGTPDAGDIDTFFSQWLNGGC
jgi:hypothetical protein